MPIKHFLYNFDDELQAATSHKKINGIYIILKGNAIVIDIFGANIANLTVGDIIGEGLLFNEKVNINNIYKKQVFICIRRLQIMERFFVLLIQNAYIYQKNFSLVFRAMILVQ